MTESLSIDEYLHSRLQNYITINQTNTKAEIITIGLI